MGSPCGSLGITLLPWGQTIFEINATSRTPASTVMRSKRRHDHALIEKFQRGQQEKKAAALKGQGLCPAAPEPQDGEGEQEDLQVMGSWMQELLQSCLGPVLAAPGPPYCAGSPGLVQRFLAGMLGGCGSRTSPLSPSRTCSPMWEARSEKGAEEEKTVPGKSRSRRHSRMRTSTSHTGPRTLRVSGGKSGGAPAAVPSQLCGGCSHPHLCRLSVGGEGSAFEQQAAGAVLDLMGDENHNLNKSKQMLKW